VRLELRAMRGELRPLHEELQKVKSMAKGNGNSNGNIQLGESTSGGGKIWAA